MRFLTLLLAISFLLSGSYAERFYVSDDASPSGDGSSWGSAFQFLQDALDQTVAGRGDEIWVEAGTYFPDDGASVAHEDRTATFTLKSDVYIYGGFSGGETAIEERNLDSLVTDTVLSGEIVGESQFWSLHVVTATGSSTLDGLIVCQGNANGDDNSSFDVGGGLLAMKIATLINCEFRNNTSKNSGGAIHGEATIINCIFENNTTGVQGGAIYTPAFSTISRSEFRFNSASDGGAVAFFIGGSVTDSVFDTNSSGNLGGAIFSTSRGDLELEDTMFVNNSAARGGSVFGKGSVEQCTFENNTAKDGGAFLVSQVSVIKDSDFRNNHASEEGGAIYLENNAAIGEDIGSSFEECLFESNSGRKGGAIYVHSSGALGVKKSPNITNSIFWNNSARLEGGGIALSKGRVQNCIFLENSSARWGAATHGHYINCTIVSNTATEDNGGGAFKSVTLFNCVLYANLANGEINHVNGGARDFESPEESPFPDPNPPELVRYPNLIQGGITYLLPSGVDLGPDLIDATPNFSNIGNPFGPDLTWRTADDGLRPSAGGNLVDTGDSGALSEDIETDVAGFYRVQGANVDLGAYEFGNQIDLPFDLTIMVSPEGSGTVSDSGDGTYIEGSTATLTATPAVGYLFSSWGGGASGTTNQLELVMDSDKSVTAFFVQDTSDADEDGLSLYDEVVVYGTNPDSADSSGDGVNDGDAVAVGLDPAQSYSAILSVVQASPSTFGLVGEEDVHTLVNVSARVRIGANESVIPGFVVIGEKQFLIRAVGPKLADLGVPSPLPDPTMTVFRSRFDGNPPDEIAMVDDWKEGGADVAAINAAMASTGAFPLEPVSDFQGNPLPTDDTKSAATLVTLSTGVYTVVVTSADDGDGEVLVEVYEVTE